MGDKTSLNRLHKPGVAELLLALLVAPILPRQCFVVYEPAGSSEAPHSALAARRAENDMALIIKIH